MYLALYNQLFVASEIIIFNIIGLFGNVNFIVLIYRNPHLRSKSSYLQCALSFSHIICLLFELPNAVLLFTGIRLHRSTCFPAISTYIFFICAQAVIMLMLVIDLFIIVFFTTFYRKMDNLQYTILMLLPPFVYATFTVTWGFLTMDDEIVIFCNPPLSLHPTVSRFWGLSCVLLNTVTLILLVALLIFFHRKNQKKKEECKLVARIKLTVIVFVISWYAGMLGVELFVRIGLKGDVLAFFQSNLVLFALICYSQQFYATLWRSMEYRVAFMKLWNISRYGNSQGTMGRRKGITAITSFVRK